MKAVWLIIGLCLTGIVNAEDSIERMHAEKMESFRSASLQWKDEPILPKGAKSALLVGDPTKAGVFIVRLKFPAHYPIPAHTHPFTEVITVLKGKLGNGMGNKLNKQHGEILHVGDSFVLPTNHAHYVWTEDEETEVELIATGPWDITYIDAKDDPRKAK
ncbi:cupin domain-containing protein [Methylovorus glucosotrophus]|uniref:Cupin 2 conserved barrel domain protein n=1 Tax=Methylovorus glucosotrophus (strain SIP3-4) TaxID=582744 RepID=C6XB98_METGS|nr:cupin domain-containing protein [Methylovorus glucosotrophus]ACT51868.1 Cupin 2 conserved barrel domain protein [Methylovorus glucosotrophus SIP3-4]KAF0842870.1 quercetin dioxygenase-like cupin family protein [Methylovorus glucosotrophus]